MHNNQTAEHTSATGTEPISGTVMFLMLFCLTIGALLWLNTPEPGHVDPPKMEWSDIPTCANGGRSDCGSVSGLSFNPHATLNTSRIEAH